MAKNDEFSPTEHQLVPKHELATATEIAHLKNEFQVELSHLPKIRRDDPGIASLGLKVGDIIKITRKSLTAGTVTFFRGVVDE